MKIGVRGHDYGRHSAAEYARLLRAEGYDTVQLAVPKAIEGVNGFDEITPKLLDEIREEFLAQKVEIGVFSCYVDLSNPDREVRTRAVETFCRGLGFAKAAGAKMTGTETSYEKLGRMEKCRRFPYMLESVKRIAEEAERVGMTIGLEPVAFHPLEDVETAMEVLGEVGSDKLRLIFDAANLAKAAGGSTGILLETLPFSRRRENRRAARKGFYGGAGRGENRLPLRGGRDGACAALGMDKRKGGDGCYPGRACGFGFCPGRYCLFAEDKGGLLNILTT